MTEDRIDRRTFLRAMGGGVAAIATATPASAQTPVANAGEDAPATGILMYPADRTVTASENTEISFRNVPPSILGMVRVTGGVSGGHSGVMYPHADGQGASFVSDGRYQPGEEVTVEADVPIGRAGSRISRFRVALPAPRPKAPAERTTDAPSEAPQAFHSRPDIHPPRIRVTTPAVETGPCLIFVAPKIPDGQNGAMILDETGELVWYGLPAIDASQCNDLKVQQWRGQPVLTWWEGVTPVGYGYGHFVIMNSAYERIASVQVGNGFAGGDLHEFILTSRGTALCLLYHPVRWNLSPVGGPVNGVAIDCIVQELEVETGRVLFEWHSLDHIDIAETYAGLPKDLTKPLDYVHLNSIDEDDDGNLIVSGRNTHAIYKVDRDSGGIIWRLNGRRSDFRMGYGTAFAFQHHARRRPDGTLSLFDNATDRPDAGDAGIASRGLALDLNMATMRASLIREYVHPTGIVSVSQGNMQELPNGNVFIGWGSAPVFSEFGPDGELLFNGRFPIGVMSYRAFREVWTGRPATPPDAAIMDGAVYASWNGATEVASWRVIGGDERDALQPVAESPRTGFETAISGQFSQTWLAVRALDAAGNALGESAPVRNRL
ncbi:MAG TPA: arylsulfotransferase family protein [Thermomicrobiales bacterium]|nr:arylsulfotransferase family protein [Thermomicrobiales bacterium]